MKKHLSLLVPFLMLIFIGCKKETVTTTKVIEKPSPSRDTCYAYELKGSKIELQLHYLADSDSVTGTLNFGFAEKDSNNGTIKGKVAGAVLIADYTFQSEGTISVRQVAFELKDNKAILGYGEMTPNGTHFKDVTKVKFDYGVPLTKVPPETSLLVATRSAAAVPLLRQQTRERLLLRFYFSYKFSFIFFFSYLKMVTSPFALTVIPLMSL